MVHLAIIEEQTKKLDTSEMTPMNKNIDIYRQDEKPDKKFWERFNVF